MCLVASASTPVVAQNGLTVAVSRTVGTAFGNFIQGSFRVVGSGPDDIQKLSILFNGVEVHSVNESTVSWAFVTSDYSSGSTNVTLVGWDSEDNVYTASTNVFIIDPNIGNFITIAIIALVAVALFVKYGGILRKKT